MGAGGNLAVSTGADGVAIVDTQFAEMVERLTAAVKKISDKPIAYAINTHWHFDHTGGNEGFGKAGVRIVAHENTFARMTTRQVIAAMNMNFEPAPRAALPEITFKDAATLHFNGQTVELLHLPRAHTDTDALIVFKEADVVHTGDVYTRMTYPFVDTSSGGTLKGLIAARKTILARINDDTRVIPGHGDLSTKAELAESVAMLEQVESRIAAAVKAGKTLEQVLADKPTAEFDAKYAPRPDQGAVFVTRAYNELAGK
jgi:glyoxylase-like metal-dependent hydrolase (beta-lactamase superfamily II)